MARIRARPGRASNFVLVPEVRTGGGGGVIPLLDGDNILEMDSPAQGEEVALDPSEDDVKGGGVFEKQALLRTTGCLPGTVSLLAYRDVRVRGKPSGSKQPPLRARSSPIKAARPKSPGKAARSKSPGKTAGRPASSPSPTARWGGGGTTRVMTGAHKYLLVGETFDLGIVGAGKGKACRYSYTLQLASSSAAAAEAQGRPGSAGKLTVSDARSNKGTPSSSSLGARGGGSSSGGLSSGVGDDSGPKRRLEGLFADTDAVVKVVPAPRPEPIDIEAEAEAAARAAPTGTKRRRRDGSRVGSASRRTPFNPVGVVDLCDADDLLLSAGKSREQPVNLCDSDGEDATARLAAPAGAPAAPILPGGSGGGGSSSAGGIANRVPPPDDIKPKREPQAARRITPGIAPEGVSLVRETRPTTIENDDQDPMSALPPLHPHPPLKQQIRRCHPRPSEVKPGECEKKRSLSSTPSVGGDVAVPSHDAPGVTAMRPWVDKPEPMARPLTRMDDRVRSNLMIHVRDCADATVPAVHEFLACGTAPPSTLCDTFVSELLQSRCRVRTQCLRRQLRAVLDVDPDSWKPPEEGAHLWLAEVMNGIVGYDFAKRAETNDAVLEAHATVLEVVLDSLVAGPAQRVMDFFPKKKEKGKRKPKLTPARSAELAREDAERERQNAKTAVETSARWAVGVWGWTVSSAGAGTGGTEGTGGASRRRRERRETPALVRARLLVASLLAEVVETCGLPAGSSCAAILQQMNSFAGVPAGAAGGEEVRNSDRDGRAAAGSDGGATAAAGAVGEECRGLGAAARGGFVRALSGRPFCAELARALGDDLGDGSQLGDIEGVGRLRALLLRVLRRSRGNADALLL